MKIIIVNGPNLGRLGQREPDIYGAQTLEDLEADLRAYGRNKGLERPGDLVFFQSNHEGALIDFIEKEEGVGGLIINPGALTHYSYALYDCIRALNYPALEVHLSNIYGREDFRQRSVTAGACQGLISGLGAAGYRLALDYLLEDQSGHESVHE